MVAWGRSVAVMSSSCRAVISLVKRVVHCRAVLIGLVQRAVQYRVVQNSVGHISVQCSAVQSRAV